MAYHLLKDLLPHIEAFESLDLQKNETNDFAYWLLQKADDERMSKNLEKKGEITDKQMRLYVENSRFLVNLYRYAKIYAKKAIPTNSPIAFDDYSYLVVLFYEGKQTKMQLIERNIHEKSTGMEIIKRLIKLGLIEQEDNLEDKRSKNIFLTPYGIESMEVIQSNMWALTATINGNLSNAETQQLNTLLAKLNLFHEENSK
jgi:DNA-binding MarR family transcriptional regulator